MIRSLLSFITVLLLIPLWAQDPVQFTQDNGDCTGALFITDSIYRTDQAVRGFGNKLEIKENPSEDLQWFEREHHTIWYKFRVPVKCNLTFDIVPNDKNDDFDFIIFEGAIPGICDKIASKQVIPVRSNISRNDPSVGSMCGLSKEATSEFVRSGIGASYSSSMEVEQGQLFYLVVDAQDRPRGGYEIRFHYDPPPPPPPVEKEKAQQHLVINIVDAKSGKPIDATLTIDGMRFDEVTEASGKSKYEYDMDVYRNLKVGCTRKGYMFTTVRAKGSTDPEVIIDIKLVPISAGEKVVLDDIRFVGNEDKVMRQSEASLLLLLRFMQENPKVKIEVQGHVNGPTFKNKKEFIELSTARARTVYDFLLINDLDPSRISYQGLGNSEMLFPEPRNREQSEANRRVEVKVMGL
ncbi:MAG TPA: OmpA family protein [Flavobacteriales bacterium]|jgi:flagellar motor protein MotB|nr:OmpA family protein [Flavobacteriales bacterium]MBK8708369.1 OmpA family protein [Flavobacteriales bacterium]MBP9178805.1 OmpA family protein [Flavobacteriales bacterium]HQW07402.1 OmpA family protein [Flavobacteriales bacterium]HQX00435.1 OmpA family protein [Flavobacteriales bacterium]